MLVQNVDGQLGEVAGGDGSRQDAELFEAASVHICQSLFSLSTCVSLVRCARLTSSVG